MDKLIWYYSTPNEEEYKLYKAQYESAQDFYIAKGYDTQLKTEFNDPYYTVHLEVYEIKNKEQTNSDVRPNCTSCT